MVTGIFHHVGTLLLFVAAILLLITTITAPVVPDLAMLKVILTNRTAIRNSSVTFGTFGHCILDGASSKADEDFCTKTMIGYNPALIMAGIEHITFSDAAENTSKALTRVMVLHPVACGLTFIAFLLALGSGFIGAISAAIVSSLAFIVTIVVMACDFVAFGIVKNKVNSAGTGNASFSTGMWTILAAMILLFLATVIVLLTCCSSRMHNQNKNGTGNLKHGEAGYTNRTTTTKRHFWQRRTRY